MNLQKNLYIRLSVIDKENMSDQDEETLEDNTFANKTFLSRFWSRGLVKSRQKNWRESRSRETEVGEKIAVTSTNSDMKFE